MDTFNTAAGAHAFTIYGPKAIEGRIGTAETIKRIRNAYAADEYIREHDEKLPKKGLKLDAHDIGPGVVYDRDGIKITAFAVDHGPWAKPALGYRVDYDGRSVLLSGDTRYNANEPLLDAARGVDVLVQEVADARHAILESKMGTAIMHHHTSAQQAGKVFAQIQPKLAVYSHIVLLGNEDVPPPELGDVTVKTRQTYGGPLLIGRDLTSIVIGKSAVTVEQPQLGLLPVGP